MCRNIQNSSSKPTPEIPHPTLLMTFVASFYRVVTFTPSRLLPLSFVLFKHVLTILRILNINFHFKLLHFESKTNFNVLGGQILQCFTETVQLVHSLVEFLLHFPNLGLVGLGNIGYHFQFEGYRTIDKPSLGPQMLIRRFESPLRECPGRYQDFQLHRGNVPGCCRTHL